MNTYDIGLSAIIRVDAETLAEATQLLAERLKVVDTGFAWERCMAALPFTHSSGAHGIAELEQAGTPTMPTNTRERLSALAELIANGLTQAEVLRAFSEYHPAIAVAKKMYAEGSDNDIEIDDGPGTLISETDDGCWVSAWLWVPKEHYDGK